MRKFFSLIAAVLFAGSMMATSITITAESGFKSSYGSGDTFTVDEVEFWYTGAMYNGKGTPVSAASKFFIQLRKSGNGAGEIKNNTQLSLKTITIATQNDKDFTLSVGTAADALSAVTKPAGTTGTYSFTDKENAPASCDVTIYTFNVEGNAYFDISNGANASYFAYVIVELSDGGDVPPVEPEAKYYLVGNFSDWAVDANYELALNPFAGEGIEEYMISGVELEELDSIKVKGVRGEEEIWYPEGEAKETNYPIKTDGKYTVYFRPAGQMEDWWKGFFYVEAEKHYYLAGSFNEWEIDDEFELFELEEGRYRITDIELEAEDSIKVVCVQAGEENAWYPAGKPEDTNYAIDRDSIYTITFRPDGQGDKEEGWWEGYFLVEAQAVIEDIAISLTQFIADKPEEAVMLKDLTVIFATPTGKDDANSNTYVIDEDGVALVIYDKGNQYYDGKLAAGTVLSKQLATYTSYNNQDEIIPANTAEASKGDVPSPELVNEAPAEFNRYIAFKEVAAVKKDKNYYILDGAVQLYGATSELKPTEDAIYNVAGIYINFKGEQPELIVTYIEKVGDIEPGEGDEVIIDVVYAEAGFVPAGVDELTQEAYDAFWQINLYKDYDEKTEEVTYPDFYIGVVPKSETAIAGTYSAETDITFIVIDLDEETEVYAVEASDFVVTYLGKGVYHYELEFTGEDEKIYVLDVKLETVAWNFETGEEIILTDDEPQAVANVTVDGKAVKAIVGGRLIIKKNGAEYNAAGQMIK